MSQIFRVACLCAVIVSVGAEAGSRAQAPAALTRIDALIAAGKYTDAETAAREELARVGTGSGSDTDDTAAILNRLAYARLKTDRHDADTSQLVSKALALLERRPPSPELAAALKNEALLCEARGDMKAALPLYVRALDVLRSSVGADAPAAVMMQKDVALTHLDLGDHARARSLLEDAFAKAQTIGMDATDLTIIRHNLGIVYWNGGEYARARDAFLESSRGFERIYGGDHPNLANALEGLGAVQVALGDYAAAQATNERALGIRTRILSPDHTDLGNSYANLGDLLATMGDYRAAKAALERSLAIWEKALGPDHPRLIVALTNLAVVRQELGDRAGARSAFERGIAIREKSVGKDDPDLIIPLTRLANLVADEGDLQSAQALYARARAIGERTRGENHPYVAAALLEEGLRLAARGDRAGGAPLIERARRIRESALGPDHPDVASALDASARLAAADGRDRDAVDLALKAEATARRHFRATAAVLAEREALTYGEGRTRSQDLAVRAAVRAQLNDPQLVERLWDAVIRSRALVLDEMAWRRHVSAAAADPGLKTLVDEVASGRARLAQLFVRGPSPDTPAGYADEIADARAAAEGAEEALGRRSAIYAQEHARGAAGFDAVRDQLPAGASLVSFVRYADVLFDPPAALGAAASSSAYAAFVLPQRDAAPVLVPLGDASGIDALVAKWRRLLREESTAPPSGAAQREQRYRAAAAALRARIWDPIASRLVNSTRVMMVPDGAISLVAFEALPSGPHGYLIDRPATLHYASAERDLMGDTSPAGSGLLAVGAPAFTRVVATPPVAGANVLRSECALSPGVRFSPIPESALEVAAIARTWDAHHDPALLLRGAAASEQNVRTHASGRRVLHFATHGFVAGEGCAPRRGAGAGPATKAEVLAANPLLGAGLVLAGASARSRAANGGDDGILTAEEISSLDLTGVEWAVLSACDSGGGVTRAGEGVFGLRRAFQIAGARTVIMSLWAVDDQMARRWMETLYAARFDRRGSTADAVREASRSTIEARRRAGLSTHPFYWSGFVATGEWR